MLVSSIINQPYHESYHECHTISTSERDTRVCPTLHVGLAVAHPYMAHPYILAFPPDYLKTDRLQMYIWFAMPLEKHLMSSRCGTQKVAAQLERSPL